tara:strand:- start:28862 stop:29758 length:897 start_codon:yes stop_codon:yes gene_type:complete
MRHTALWDPTYSLSGTPYAAATSVTTAIRARQGEISVREINTTRQGVRLDGATLFGSAAAIGAAAFGANGDTLTGTTLFMGGTNTFRQRLSWRDRAIILGDAHDALDCIVDTASPFQQAAAEENYTNYRSAAAQLRSLHRHVVEIGNPLISEASAEARLAFDTELANIQNTVLAYSDEENAMASAPLVMMSAARMVNRTLRQRELDALPDIEAIIEQIRTAGQSEGQLAGDEEPTEAIDKFNGAQLNALDAAPASLSDVTIVARQAREAVNIQTSRRSPAYRSLLPDIAACPARAGSS